MYYNNLFQVCIKTDQWEIEEVQNGWMVLEVEHVNSSGKD